MSRYVNMHVYGGTCPDKGGLYIFTTSQRNNVNFAIWKLHVMKVVAVIITNNIPLINRMKQHSPNHTGVVLLFY